MHIIISIEYNRKHSKVSKTVKILSVSFFAFSRCQQSLDIVSGFYFEKWARKITLCHCMAECQQRFVRVTEFGQPLPFPLLMEKRVAVDLLSIIYF